MNKKIIVKQNGYKDCGPSCLLSIMRYFGLEASHEEVSYILKTDIDGTSAYDIINGCRTFGFDGYGIHYSYDEIVNNKISFPIICHVKIDNMYHFIVVYKVKKDKLIIMDPASVKNKISKEDFKSIYLNTSLVIYPVKEIKKINSHISLFKLISDYLIIEKNNVIKFCLLSIITIILSIIVNYYLMVCIDIVLPNYNNKIFLSISILFMNIYLFRNIFNYYKSKIMFNIEKDISLKLNVDIIRKYFNLPYQFFKSKSTGEIISRLNDMNSFKIFISQIISNLFTNSLLIIISFLILLFLNRSLFIINLFGIFLYVLIVILFRNKCSVKSEDVLISNSLYDKTLNECIYGYEINKNLNLVNENIKRIEILYLKYLNKNYLYEKLMNIIFLLKESISNISYMISISVGIIYIYEGVITIGEFLLFNSVISYFKEPIKDILDLEPSIIYVKKIYNRVNDIVMMRDIKENGIFFEMKDDIYIRNLSYSRRNNLLFKDVNFNIKYGSKFMLYGKSGYGKSTIMKIIMKYLTEYEGEIFFGKINLKDISYKCILENITYVSQHGFLNNETFKENIICGRNISNEEYENVIEICNLSKLRDSNRDRNDFLIEEDGFNISGGERQKIILARSILKKSNYYIFDEALSEIGIREEIEIINKLFQYLGDKTIIYISHKKEIIDLFSKKYKLERRRSNDKRK